MREPVHRDDPDALLLRTGLIPDEPALRSALNRALLRACQVLQADDRVRLSSIMTTLSSYGLPMGVPGWTTSKGVASRLRDLGLKTTNIGGVTYIKAPGKRKA